MGMDISQSRAQVSLAATTAYNTDKALNIKAFRASEEADVVYSDQEGTVHTVGALKGEVFDIQGAISIDVTNPQALLIFL